MRAGVMMAVVLAVALPSATLAKPPLRDVTAVDDGVMYVAIADRLRKDCDNLGARMIRAMSRLNDLKGTAKAAGYSDAEIEAYHTSKAEKARMKTKATAWLQARGVSVKDKSGFCAFGIAEIKRGSPIGTLLRER
ncbi:DUF5333 domain-containing protein [Pseudaestuariivita atlantica]|uniref:NADH dehydrogenase n=1 Tax=Pseudaestuariivita atlantica TaxID=1317121 RepID=A0A0L1JM66_9RHOB|nr:DUF5333 domain-containing protein [Pseudaestuariivita atlantica]KNG92478.1 hypothetical protein ATO11_17900 [Pseudaestuariivita atlantica]